VICFDVFDTLVQRTLPHPDTTKIPAAKALLALSISQSPGLSLDHILRKRGQVESALRRQAAARGEDPECHIEEVFSHWLSAVGLQPGQKTIDELIEVELQAELAVSFATPGMLELIKNLAKQQFRMVFASDMTASLFYRILEHGYVNCFSQGYVSSGTKRIAAEAVPAYFVS
jgi:predicted HAD superfamily hydrolase